MVVRKLVAVLGLAVCAVAAVAQPAGERKYCGSGWNRNLVPDNIAGCELAQACKAHDVCYGKCDPGGALEGSDYCKLPESSPERTLAKQKCDEALLADIKAANPNKPVCTRVGRVYAAAVRKLGQGPFNGRPMSNQAMFDLARTSGSDHEAADKAATLFDLAEQGKVDLSSATATKQALTVKKLDPLTSQPKGELVLKKGMSQSQLKNAAKFAAQ